VATEREAPTIVFCRRSANGLLRRAEDQNLTPLARSSAAFASSGHHLEADTELDPQRASPASKVQLMTHGKAA
jgi:hypothetical protein